MAHSIQMQGQRIQNPLIDIYCIYRMSQTIMQFKMTNIPDKFTSHYLNNQRMFQSHCQMTVIRKKILLK